MPPTKKPAGEPTRKDQIDALLLALPGVQARNINGLDGLTLLGRQELVAIVLDLKERDC